MKKFLAATMLLTVLSVQQVFCANVKETIILQPTDTALLFFDDKCFSDKDKFCEGRFYNTDNLSEAKFRKQVDLLAAQLEREINIAYQNSEQIHTKVLTFSELMSEWKATVKANQSLNYYMRVCETEKRFTAFLKERRLDSKPISDIRVRDIQLFLNSFTEYKKIGNMYRLKKDFPKTVSMRELADKKIIEDVRIAYGVAGPVPMRAPSAEAKAKRQPTTRAAVDTFARTVLEDIHPRDSWRAAKDFREHIAVVLARRALTQSIRLAGGELHE